MTSISLSGCSTADRAFSKGEKLEAEGNYEDAMYSYADAFRSDPETGDYRARFFKVRDKAAENRYKMGMDLYDRGNYDGALAEFQTANVLDPTQGRFKQKIIEATRLRNAQMVYREGQDFEKANKLKNANQAYISALELHPDNKEYQEALARVSGQRKSKLEGFELSLKSSKPITLKFKDAKIKDVFKIITQLTGINFIFDEAVKDQPVSIYLENATFQQAMDLLTNMNKLHGTVLNESTVLLYPKTPEKSKQYEDMTMRIFHLTYMDAKKAINLIRTMLQVKKIYVNEESNAIVVRDTADIVAVVEKILEASDMPDPEVVLEVEVIELSNKNTQNLGLLLSDYSLKFGAFSPAGKLFSSSGLTASTAAVAGTVTNPTTGNTAAIATDVSVASVDNLLNVFRYNGYTGWMTVPNASYNFGKTLAKGEVLSNPKLRVKNKEKAKFNVGQRVPITTTTSNAGTQTQVNVQYVDVGVKVNAEPNIQLNNEVVIKVSLEVSSIIQKETVGGKDSATTVVTIGTKNLDTVLSLKDGETSVIGGLLQNTSSESKQQVVLIGDIPLIGPLLSSRDTTKDKTELVLAITPRLVRGVTVPIKSLTSFTTGKEDEPSLQRPMASFDQEPVFEGENKELPARQASKPTQPTQQTKPTIPPKPVKPTLPAAAASPAGPGVAQPVTIPGTTAVQPVDPNVKQPVVSGEPAVVVPADVKNSLPQTSGTSDPAVTTAPADTTVPAAAKPVAPVVVKPGLLQIGAPANINVGQQFYVDIKVADVQNLNESLLVLSFDPKLVEHVSTSEGPFLKKDGKPTIFSATTNVAEGTVTIKLTRAPGSGGYSGTGSLVSALFRAKGKGPASFNFQSVSFSTPDGKPLEMLPFSTAVNVR
jgi:general secretion pathway protein D